MRLSDMSSSFSLLGPINKTRRLYVTTWVRKFVWGGRGSNHNAAVAATAAGRTQTLFGVKFEVNFPNKSSFADDDPPPRRPAGPPDACCCCLG